MATACLVAIMAQGPGYHCTAEDAIDQRPPPSDLLVLEDGRLNWVSPCQCRRRRREPQVEAGTGKLALARGAHQDVHPTGKFLVVECASSDPTADAVDTASAPGLTVVLRHLDRLPPSRTATVDALLDDVLRRDPRAWVVATVGSAGAAPETLLRHFSATVTAPPLRHRTGDLDHLVRTLLHRVAPGRQTICGEDAMRVLARNAWTGNVAELRDVLAAAVSNRPVGVLREKDLPPSCFTTSRRVLAPMEVLERDAIVRALTDAGGNRKDATAALGMSRSSLYRKMHAFGVT